MIRLILVSLLLLLSLLTIFRAPTNGLWYVSILATEFCWVFFLVVLLIVSIGFKTATFPVPVLLVGGAAMVLFMLPILQAYKVSASLNQKFTAVFGADAKPAPDQPFQLLRMFSVGTKAMQYETMPYDTAKNLTLDFYRSTVAGPRPCVVVIHGGSWAGGDSRQLPELNSELAMAGYQVVSINYRLAPGATFPSTTEDVQKALQFLRQSSSKLAIDTGNLFLLGRSAGGQIALTAAYTLPEEAVKGVICFYGPTDMVWGYRNPTSPLILNSRKIMEDYLGGTLAQQPDKYKLSSATETVSRQTPPTLMIYGGNDPLVSPLHGTRLIKPLKANGVKYVELYMPWATHGFDWTLNGPGGQLSTWAVKRFLKHLAHRSPSPSPRDLERGAAEL